MPGPNLTKEEAAARVAKFFEAKTDRLQGDFGDKRVNWEATRRVGNLRNERDKQIRLIMQRSIANRLRTTPEFEPE